MVGVEQRQKIFFSIYATQTILWQSEADEGMDMSFQPNFKQMYGGETRYEY